MSNRFMRRWWLGLVSGILGVGLIVGCSGGHETTANAMPDSVAVLSSSLGKPVVNGNEVVRNGDMTIRIKDRAPHHVKVTIRSRITRGDEDTVMTVEDTTAGATMTFGLSDEASEGNMATSHGVVDAVFNADGTVSVGDTTYPDNASAAEAIANSPATQGATAEGLTAVVTVIDQMQEETDGTSRWRPVRKFIKNNWKDILIFIIQKI